MKQNLLYLLLGIFLLASCQKEERFAEETATGYLSLTSITLQADIQTIFSRAVDSELYVEIQQTGETYRLYETGTVPAKIELPAGTYQLCAYNAASQMENPYEGLGKAVFYQDGKTFEVKAGEVTSFELEVPMVNFGVTLRLPEEFAAYFGDNYAITVTSDRSEELKERETAYFPYDSDKVTFSYSLKATNADGEEPEPEGGTRNEVVSGTIYTVSYEMETQSFHVVR